MAWAWVSGPALGLKTSDDSWKLKITQEKKTSGGVGGGVGKMVQLRGGGIGGSNRVENTWGQRGGRSLIMEVS